jgi:uncharacterized membrane protein
MDGWTLVRFVHVLAFAFFVGGQLMLAAVVVPAVRRHGADAAMRALALRFGVGSLIALALLLATGIAMASRTDRWGDSELRVKLMLVVLVGILVGLHVVTPRSRVLSIAVLVASLAIVWVGVVLSHG